MGSMYTANSCQSNYETSFVELTAGDYRASISAFGGGLRSLDCAARPLVLGYPRGQFPTLSSGIILAPWPNRTADGVFAHDGQVHRLRITEPSRATAIHGFVGSMVWDVIDQRDNAVTLSVASENKEGWPWHLRMTATWELDADRGLSARVTVRNEDTESCPFGLGWHPYLSAMGAPLDECTLHLPASTNLPLDPVRNLPAGPEIPAERVLPTLRRGQLMAGMWLDHCFGGVPDGGSSVELINSEGLGVRLTADGSFPWYQIFTADPARREGYPGVGRAVAVEPMTCPPDALRTGRDLLTLSAGEEKSFRMGVAAVVRAPTLG